MKSGWAKILALAGLAALAISRVVARRPPMIAP